MRWHFLKLLLIRCYDIVLMCHNVLQICVCDSSANVLLALVALRGPYDEY